MQVFITKIIIIVNKTTNIELQEYAIPLHVTKNPDAGSPKERIWDTAH